MHRHGEVAVCSFQPAACGLRPINCRSPTFLSEASLSKFRLAGFLCMVCSSNMLSPVCVFWLMGTRKCSTDVKTKPIHMESDPNEANAGASWLQPFVTGCIFCSVANDVPLLCVLVWMHFCHLSRKGLPKAVSWAGKDCSWFSFFC